MEGRVPELFVPGGFFRWKRDSPGAAGRDVCGYFEGAARGTRAVQEADGLAFQMGVVVGNRFQLRLPGVGEEGRRSQWEDLLQLRAHRISLGRTAGRERLLQGCEGRHLPYLFHLWPRSRHSAESLQLSRYGAEGKKRRGIAVPNGLG